MVDDCWELWVLTPSTPLRTEVSLDKDPTTVSLVSVMTSYQYIHFPETRVCISKWIIDIHIVKNYVCSELSTDL